MFRKLSSTMPDLSKITILISLCIILVFIPQILQASTDDANSSNNTHAKENANLSANIFSMFTEASSYMVLIIAGICVVSVISMFV
jgi:hypothetical protein